MSPAKILPPEDKLLSTLGLCARARKLVMGTPMVCEALRDKKTPVIAVLEASAILAEWLCYRQTDNDVHHPLLFSLCANGFSYCAGHLLQLFL